MKGKKGIWNLELGIEELGIGNWGIGFPPFAVCRLSLQSGNGYLVSSLDEIALSFGR